MNKHKLVKHRRAINIFVRTIANTLIILAIIFLGIGIWPYLQSELGYDWRQLIGQSYYVGGDHPTAATSPLGSILGEPPPLKITPVNTNFSIIIPKIDVNASVTGEVDVTNQAAYFAALEHGAAHAKGTVYPGQNGNSFIFAHSTLNFWDVARYNAVFTLLRKLEPGDRIVTFYKRQRFDYIVKEKKIVDPTDVSSLSPVANGRQLTLQTCDPPGTSLRRLLVIAKMD